MKKVLSSALVALMVVLSGCQTQEKSDAEQIKETFTMAVSGDGNYIVEVEKSTKLEEIKNSGGPINEYKYGFTSKSELTGIMASSECVMAEANVVQKWGTASVTCGSRSTNKYFEKEDGRWKLLVTK